MDSFDQLPLSCIINNKFIALHGGLSPELDNVPPLTPPQFIFNKIEDIKRINRFREPPSTGLFCDILWSDPLE